MWVQNLGSALVQESQSLPSRDETLALRKSREIILWDWHLEKKSDKSVWADRSSSVCCSIPLESVIPGGLCVKLLRRRKQLSVPMGALALSPNGNARHRHNCFCARSWRLYETTRHFSQFLRRNLQAARSKFTERFFCKRFTWLRETHRISVLQEMMLRLSPCKSQCFTWCDVTRWIP